MWESRGKNLLKAHLDALYTRNGIYLERINEPWGALAMAPKLHICTGIQGDILIGRSVIFSPGEPLKMKEQECCYLVPPLPFPSHTQVCRILPGSAEAKKIPAVWNWLQEELIAAQPCVGVFEEDICVSICRSVRIGREAQEAGVETLESFRGRGYAELVVTGWANLVREQGSIPLYSHSRENMASLRVAQKTQMLYYAEDYILD